MEKYIPDSTAIDYLIYKEETKTVYIKYKSTSLEYKYCNVEVDDWKKLILSDDSSIGKYVSNIFNIEFGCIGN